MYHYYKRRIRGNQINLHIIYIALEMHLWYTEIMQFIVDFSQGNGGKQMKRTIRKMLAVVLSCVLFTGCGAAQKIDDYATNEGAQKTAKTAEKVEEAKQQILSGENGVFDGVIETNDGKTVGKEGKTLDDKTITGGINWYFKTVEVVK